MATNDAGIQLEISLDNVVFAEATPEQRELSWRLNGVSWASPLSIDDYVGRETALSQTALSANGGTKYFILHHKDDHNAILSACEVTTKEVIVADASGARIVEGYAIASVFTAPEYRGHGLAKHLLIQVRETMDKTAEFGALYSDIGREFYTKLGWKDFSSQQVIFQLDKSFKPTESENTTPLADGDVEMLCKKDVLRLMHKFGIGQSAVREDGKTRVAFLPSYTQFAWQFTRDSFFAKALRGIEKVERRGARTNDGKNWIIWDHDLREPKLKIMRIYISENQTTEERTVAVKQLLQAALAEASAWELPKIGVWSPGKEVSQAAVDIWQEVGSSLSVGFESRSADSIPSLRVKGDQDVGEIVWEENEYYAWC
ncbi:hypothetical protein CC79DRAFT_1333847 [Sarocladium strictum]